MTPFMESDPGRPIAYALWPLGAALLGASRLKAALYPGLLHPLDLGRPAIAVGNLTFGGTGKTPVTLALASILREMGLAPGILLRGYGRTTRGPREVTSEEGAEAVGDEAILLRDGLPGVPVAVAERREDGAALLRGRCSVFLLDDAFQHLRVGRAVDLLLVDATRPGDLHAPPVGRLREPLSAARRASAVVVTRGEPGDLPASLARFVAGKPLLGARFSWAERPGGTSSPAAWADLAGHPLVAFAGIGNPGAFLSQARERGMNLAGTLPFPDHARPDPARLGAVLALAASASAHAVLTTEKDAVKWAGVWPQTAPPLVYPKLEVAFSGDVPALRALIAAACGARPAP